MEGQVCVGSAVLNRAARVSRGNLVGGPSKSTSESEISRIGVLIKETAEKISTKPRLRFSSSCLNYFDNIFHTDSLKDK